MIHKKLCYSDEIRSKRVENINEIMTSMTYLIVSVKLKKIRPLFANLTPNQ